MGYTHYIYLPKDMSKDKFKAFTEDVKAILGQADDGILADGGGNIGTKPTITDKLVSFNGIDDDSHETCYIPFIDGGQSDELKFEFCKTARKPYDKFVTATYIAFKHHFPNTQISGDGGIDGYQDGLNLFCEVCRDIEMPKLN